MSDAHESDLPIEIQFQTVPQDTAASACFVDTGIESRLVSLIVAAQLQIDLQTQTEGHLAAIECESLTRVIAGLLTCLRDVRATKDVLAAA